MTDNPWIEWTGGECPVEPGALVDYQMRDGMKTSGWRAGALRWNHTEGETRCADIIAYRRHETAAAPDTEKLWLIWSIEHDAWWRPDHAGYTHHVNAAGRYTYAEALKIVAGANWGSGPVVDHDPDGKFVPGLSGKLAGRPKEAMVREDAYGKEHYSNPRREIVP